MNKIKDLLNNLIDKTHSVKQIGGATLEMIANYAKQFDDVDVSSKHIYFYKQLLVKVIGETGFEWLEGLSDEERSKHFISIRIDRFERLRDEDVLFNQEMAILLYEGQLYMMEYNYIEPTTVEEIISKIDMSNYNIKKEISDFFGRPMTYKHHMIKEFEEFEEKDEEMTIEGAEEGEEKDDDDYGQPEQKRMKIDWDEDMY